MLASSSDSEFLPTRSGLRSTLLQLTPTQHEAGANATAPLLSSASSETSSASSSSLSPSRAGARRRNQAPIPPPSWSHVQFTHLCLLLPLTLILIPLLAATPLLVLLSLNHNFHHSTSWEQTLAQLWTSCQLGLVGGLACLTLRRPIVTCFDALSSVLHHLHHRYRHHRHHHQQPRSRSLSHPPSHLHAHLPVHHRHQQAHEHLDQPHRFPQSQSQRQDAHLDQQLLCFFTCSRLSTLLTCASILAQTLATECVRLWLLRCAYRLTYLPMQKPPASFSMESTRITAAWGQVFCAMYAVGWGWSTAELALVGCYEWVHEVRLYASVLLPSSPPSSASSGSGSGFGTAHVDREPDFGGAGGSGLAMDDYCSNVHSSDPVPLMTNSNDNNDTESGSDSNEEDEEEEWLDAMIQSRQRQDLEHKLGCPLWSIPWFIVLTWRIDSTLFTLSTTLFLGTISTDTSPLAPSTPTLTTSSTTSSSLTRLLLFFIVILIRWAMSCIWTLKLSKWGLVSVTYATLLFSMICFLASLAGWGVLQ